MVKKSGFDDARKKKQQKHPFHFFEDFFIN